MLMRLSDVKLVRQVKNKFREGKSEDGLDSKCHVYMTILLWRAYERARERGNTKYFRAFV